MFIISLILLSVTNVLNAQLIHEKEPKWNIAVSSEYGAIAPGGPLTSALASMFGYVQTYHGYKIQAGTYYKPNRHWGLSFSQVNVIERSFAEGTEVTTAYALGSYMRKDKNKNGRPQFAEIGARIGAFDSLAEAKNLFLSLDTKFGAALPLSKNITIDPALGYSYIITGQGPVSAYNANVALSFKL